MLDYINGNKFSEISHIVGGFSPADFNPPKIDFSLLKDAIIFWKTDYLDYLFTYIKYSKKKYILITGMSDCSIDKKRFEDKPNCIKKWFGVNIEYDHPDLISIPLGIENHISGQGKGLFTNHEWFINNKKRLKQEAKDFILYCNWCSYSDKREVNKGKVSRKLVLQQLRKSGFKIQNRIFKIHTKPALPFEDYCEDMAKHMFIICPPGNGVDTHRTWEALYLGCYPIVIKNRIYRDWDLPIIQVNDYSEVSFDVLEESLEGKYNYEMLNMSYWKDRVIKEFNKL